MKYVGRRNELSISLHVAATHLTRIVFGCSIIVAAALAAVVFFKWLLPHYDAGIVYYLLYALLTVDFFVIPAVPHIEGTWRGTVHNFAAWGMVYLIPVIIFAAFFWPLSTAAKAVTGVLLATEIVLLMLVMFRRERFRHVFLQFQSSYLAVFFLFLLTVIYL